MIKINKSEATLKSEAQRQAIEAARGKVNVTNAEIRNLLLVVLERLDEIKG